MVFTVCITFATFILFRGWSFSFFCFFLRDTKLGTGALGIPFAAFDWICIRKTSSSMKASFICAHGNFWRQYFCIPLPMYTFLTRGYSRGKGEGGGDGVLGGI